MFHCGLIGNPIRHSWSPAIHGRFAKQFKHQLEYKLYELEATELAGFFIEFRQYGTGLNITYPYKHTVLDFIDCNKGEQENVNVIINNNQLIGCCVDGRGFLQALHKLNWQIVAQQVLVIGAGNAAYSVILELLKLQPKRIVVAVRSVARAKIKLAKILPFITIINITKLDTRFDVVIQASSAGLIGEALVVSADWFKTNSLVMDLNYGDNAQAFCNEVKNFGVNNIIDGKLMLVEQAACSYQLWTGCYPDTSFWYK